VLLVVALYIYCGWESASERYKRHTVYTHKTYITLRNICANDCKFEILHNLMMCQKPWLNEIIDAFATNTRQ